MIPAWWFLGKSGGKGRDEAWNDARALLAHFSESEMREWLRCAMLPQSGEVVEDEARWEDILRLCGLVDVRRELVRPALSSARVTPLPSALWMNEGGRESKVLAEPVLGTAITQGDGFFAPLVWADQDRRYGQRVPEWAGRIVVVALRFSRVSVLKSALGAYDPDHSLGEEYCFVSQGESVWDHYQRARQSGAKAFVALAPDRDRCLSLTAPVSVRQVQQADYDLPALRVAQHESERVRRLALRGQVVRFCRAPTGQEQRAIYNVIGELPGKRKGRDQELALMSAPLLSGKHACGLAVILAVAKFLATERAVGRGLRRPWLCLLTAGHEEAELGTRAFIASHSDWLASSTQANDARLSFAISVASLVLWQATVEGAEMLYPGHRHTHPLRAWWPEDPYQPAPSLAFISFNHQLRDAVMRGLRSFDLDRSVVLGDEGAIPVKEGIDWYRAGIPTIHYGAYPCLDAGMVGSSGPGPYLARLPRVAAACAQILQALDHSTGASLHAFDLRRSYVQGKWACWWRRRRDEGKKET